ncbi:RES family NAD+ phosphorylase [Gordonia rhizosphera]|uniref:RES domain-containing protein n=1 Tax=Gordonia rhizosphera NBRC 16068 TaxID=1108045 RepID=K6WTC2_9ACTN|nr:RES family NAD+ phosphorylase [Gordonia rhizosphera]GAB89784.1 hypothetical protein GORHZ_070_00390 [Gordonia rhizosphera NBRC 16068]
MVNERLPKVPQNPPADLSAESRDVTSFAGILWRIHRTAGIHVLAWNTPRTFGPLADMRYDPHPGPRPAASSVGVHYNATDIKTALAEVYQQDRVIDLRGNGPQLTAWRPTRPLRLLDLTDTWAIRNGASFVLNAAPKRVCRRWSRAIYEQFPDLDGIHVHSTMTGAPNIVVTDRSADAFPVHPDFSEALWAVETLVRSQARTIGYRVI